MSDPVGGFEFRELTPIDIGDPEQWGGLYREQFRLDSELVAAMGVTERLMSALQELAVGVSVETSFIEEGQEHTVPEDLVREVSDVSDQFTCAQQASFEAYERVGSIYGKVGFQEWELGMELDDITPAGYITRAIGEKHPAVAKRYCQVRAEIEIFRQLAGVTDPTVTLGPAVAEAWLQSRLEGFVLNIQRLQMAQIMLSDNPMETARAFGKEAIIKRLGLPPQIPHEEVAVQLDNSEKESWMAMTKEACAEVEPLAGGLTIDQSV